MTNCYVTSVSLQLKGLIPVSVKSAVLVFACAFFSSTAQGAIISWLSTPYTVNGAFGENLDEGLFDTSGVEVFAENLGGGPILFDGINFTASTHDFASTFDGYHAGILGNTILAADGTYEVPPSTPQSVTLAGLISGNQYRVQALVADGRSAFNGYHVEFDGIDQGIYGNGVFNDTFGDALLVTGTFTADAAIQTFTTQVFSPLNVANGGQLNALLLHNVTPVPEPGTWISFFLLLATGLFVRQRRSEVRTQ